MVFLRCYKYAFQLNIYQANTELLTTWMCDDQKIYYFSLGVERAQV